MTSVERLKLYTSVVPSRVQRSIQRDNFNAFVHYGLNTFANKEWSDGTLSPEIFNPTNQDAEQWVKVLKFASNLRERKELSLPQNIMTVFACGRPQPQITR